MDEDLLIDMYIYGFVSQAISLLMLSKDLSVQKHFLWIGYYVAGR